MSDKLGLIKILVSSLLIGSAIQAPDADGWVSVERPDSRVEEFPDEEKGIWVVFSKELDGEKFLVRFPDDPAYRHTPSGIQLNISSEGDHLQLDVDRQPLGDSLFEEKLEAIKALPSSILIKAKKSPDGHRHDFFYSLEGKWVWERVIASSNLLYTFRTESSEMTGELHRKFASSLDIFT